MKLYRNAEGEWVGTQADAGNKNVIEVPTDKPALLEWLNENARGSVDDNSVISSSSDSCPHCKLNLHAAAVQAERELATTKADAIAKWLETAPTGKVADVFVALADRYQDAANSSRQPAGDSPQS